MPPSTTEQDAAREAAAHAAADQIEPGMTLGLGSGRAVWKVIDALEQRFGESPPITVVAASTRTEHLLRHIGLVPADLADTDPLDLVIDGADEVDPGLGLIKGGGGALLREKLVVEAARKFVVVAETSKRVERLGERWRLPVEVIRFGWTLTRSRLRELMPDAELRLAPDEEPYVTDEGHYIVDCTLPTAGDLHELGRTVKELTGVVEHGLFLGLAHEALLGTPEGGVERLSR